MRMSKNGTVDEGKVIIFQAGTLEIFWILYFRD